MSKNNKILTVGELRVFLKGENPKKEITFGSSKYTRRPLIFNRTKSKGEKLLYIELSEIDESYEPELEIDNRISVEELLHHLGLYEDDWEITFGSSLDGIPLEFRNITNVVSINLEQD